MHFIEGCSAPKYNVANLHAGCVELFVGKNAKLRYSTIENWSKNMYNLNTKRATGRRGRHHRVGFRFLRFPRLLPVSHEYPEGKRCPDGVYRYHLCRKRPEPGYRSQGGSRGTGDLFLYEYPFHFQGRRYQHLPKLRGGHQKEAEEMPSRLFPVSL